MPMLASMLSSRRPACPTNGSPRASSSAPGASPISIHSRVRVADAENGLLSCLAQSACPAARDFLPQLFPLESRDDRSSVGDRRCDVGLPAATIVDTLRSR